MRRINEYSTVMSKICVVMAYYDRQLQLNKTLGSIALTRHRDFSVVIVDDGSPEDIVLPELPYKVQVLKLRNKRWTNCAPVYNTGFIHALTLDPDIIIIQSAECYHVGDVLSCAHMNITSRNYIAFGCFRLDKETTFREHDIKKLSNTQITVSDINLAEGDCAWWNHPIYNRVPQYWCAAISSKNLVILNGIDERFAHGYAYEDGYFVHQVENLGLKIDITDSPFVVHQWHERHFPQQLDGKVNPNVELYERLMKNSVYRAHHTLTPNLT
jgi:glycosyltransferase involved in cell wall biosynthesis